MTVTYFTPYVPARLNCLPEDATPEEGPEIEFEIDEGQPDEEFLDWLLGESAEFRESIEEQLIQKVAPYSSN